MPKSGKAAQPLFVTVPVCEIGALKTGETLTPSADISYSDMIAGWVPDYKIVSPDDVRAAEADLDRKIGIFVMQTKCETGFISVLSAYAIRCESVEEAMAIPGFVHLFMFTGKYRAVP